MPTITKKDLEFIAKVSSKLSGSDKCFIPVRTNDEEYQGRNFAAKSAVGKGVSNPDERFDVDRMLWILTKPNRDYFGIVPAQLGTIVLDLDLKDSQAQGIEAFERHFDLKQWFKTRSGGKHYIFKNNGQDLKNVKWHWKSPEGYTVSGDVRDSNGYHVIWDVPRYCDVLRALHGRPTASAGALSLPSVSFTPVNEVKNTIDAGITYDENDLTKEGSRHNALLYLCHKAMEEDDYKAMADYKNKAIEAGLPKEDADQVVHDVVTYHIDQRTADPADDEIKSRKKYTADAPTLVKILDFYGVSIRYDNRAERQQIHFSLKVTDETPIDTWVHIDDRIIGMLALEISQNFRMAGPGKRGLSFSANIWKTVLDGLAFQNKIDPVMGILKAIPEWDGTERLDFLLREFWGTPRISLDDPYHRWCSSAIILGAIQRTYHPGSMLPQTVVLIGPGGIGKGNFSKFLLPEADRLAYIDNAFSFVDGYDGDRKMAEILAGKLIIEGSEMAGTSKSKVEHFKSFETATEITTTFKWDRHATTIPRRFVHYWTTNRLSAIPEDPSGAISRRLAVVDLSHTGKQQGFSKIGFDVAKYLTANWQQLWAEGLHRYHTSEHKQSIGCMPPELYDFQTSVNKSYMRSDEIFVFVLNQIAPNVPDEGLKRPEVIKRMIKWCAANADTGVSYDMPTSLSHNDYRTRLTDAFEAANWNSRIKRGYKLYTPDKSKMSPEPSKDMFENVDELTDAILSDEEVDI